MVSVHDVAAFILREQGEMTCMKLQKLVYYAQAWSLVWDDEPLFPEPIEAWANGPVVPALYESHRGQFRVAAWPAGTADNLSPEQASTTRAVLGTYAKFTPHQLSQLTHREAPWLRAREGLADGDRGSRQISLEEMQQYYAALN